MVTWSHFLPADRQSSGTSNKERCWWPGEWLGEEDEVGGKDENKILLAKQPVYYTTHIPADCTDIHAQLAHPKHIAHQAKSVLRR
jgi:hypothetical protein